MKKTYYRGQTQTKRAERDWGRNSECHCDWKALGTRRHCGVLIKRERERHRKRGSQRDKRAWEPERERERERLTQTEIH